MATIEEPSPTRRSALRWGIAGTAAVTAAVATVGPGKIIGMLAPEADKPVATPMPATVPAQPVALIAPPVGEWPAWFAEDLHNNAHWIPDNIKRQGIEAAYKDNFSRFSDRVKKNIIRVNAPPWMVALISNDPSKQAEIIHQMERMADLRGLPPTGVRRQRLETLLSFAGAAQLPTPGDKRTGNSLGSEGCAAAISKYILAQLYLEFRDALGWLAQPMLRNSGEMLINTQSSVAMMELFHTAAEKMFCTYTEVAFNDLRSQHMPASTIIRGGKNDGDHMFGIARIFEAWNFEEYDRQAIGNTGLMDPKTKKKIFGDIMKIFQEYITNLDPDGPLALMRNKHGAINSRQLAKISGTNIIDLFNQKTNPYWAAYLNEIRSLRPGARPVRSNFTIVELAA